ncbi:hypothetical protein DFH06DRAFT_1145208 [Mycena polygramma]|nr:hypothetical protein DFH06DRAFT_1145208 [Mycena polygramma]
MSINSPGSHVDQPLVVTSSPENSPRSPSPKFPETTTTTTVSIAGSGSHLGDPFFVNSSPDSTPHRATTTTTTTTISFSHPGSRERPFLVTSIPTAPRRHLQIYGPRIPIDQRGPPSAIPQDVPRRAMRELPSPSQHLFAPDRARQDARRQRHLDAEAQRSAEWRAERAQRRALEGNSASNARPSGPRRRRPSTRCRRQGYRSPRLFPLEEADLYLTADRPEVLSAEERPHHQCAICLHLKAHPVSCSCGHSYCYVCIRKALEYSWNCPVCRAPMTGKPAQDWDVANAIRFDFPNRRDGSMVSYSWEGLTFPEAM